MNINGIVLATMDLTNVHVILIRHAQATSNVQGSAQSNIAGGSSLTEDDLRHIAQATRDPEAKKLELRNGEYLPDGLTQHGIDDVNRFNASVGTLDGVCLLASSPLTRAVQTLQLIKEKFGANHTTQIHCHTGLQEATPWPHDFPNIALERHEKQISYIKLQGGESDTPNNTDGNNTNRPGLVLGVETVDITNVQYPSSGIADSPTLHPSPATKAHVCHSQGKPETLHSLLNRTREARQWIRSQAIQALLQMQRHGLQEGALNNNHNHNSDHSTSPQKPLRLVVCVHGGLWNFLTGWWTCRVDPCTGSFQSSTTVPNLGVGVYRFEDAKNGDYEANLVELGESEGAKEYERILGKWYVHRGGGHGCGLEAKEIGDEAERKRENGEAKGHVGTSQVDQMRAHLEFIQKKQREVREFGQRQGGEELLGILRGWRDVETFWREIGTDSKI